MQITLSLPFWLKALRLKLAIIFQAIWLTRVDLFLLDLVLCFFVTSADVKESQMGSRGQHPGRRVEDHFARASSTLGPLGKSAQSVSRCQSQEGFGHDASKSSRHAAAHAKSQRLQAAISALGDADMAEKENLVNSFATCTSSSRGAPRLRTVHL